MATLTATDEQFFTGDGTTKTAQLSVGGTPLVRDIVDAIYQTDWQGRVELSSGARTNQFLDSQMTSIGGAPWLLVPTASRTDSPNLAPDGSGGPMCRISAHTDTTDAAIRQGGQTVGQTYIVRAFVRCDGNQFALINGFGLGGAGVGFDLINGTYQVNSNWLDAGIKIISSTLALVWAKGAPSTTTGAYFNIATDIGGGKAYTGTEYLDWWGAEQLDGDADPLSAYIPTTDSPVTVTDYTDNGDGTISLGQAVATGGTLTGDYVGIASGQLWGWPTSLPYPLQDNTSIAPLVDNVITTQMDTGAPKRRRRFTWVPNKYTTSLLLTGEQVGTLNDFVATTLKDVLPFDWYDPLTQATKAYKFVKRPTYQFDQGGYDAWIAQLELQEA